MPKGKPRKTNPDLYAGSTTPKGPSTAPQAAPHRRGGTHKVKDEDLTGTVYDTYNYVQLVEEAKARKLYYKDMRKLEMIRRLAEDYRRRQLEESIADRERSKRIQERKLEEERRVKAQQERIAAERVEKERRKEQQRERNGSVSDVTMSDDSVQGDHVQNYDWNEHAAETFDRASSEYTWTSTSSESTTYSPTRRIFPAHNLRLYEWTYEDVFPPTYLDTSRREYFPWRARYAPLRVITTNSKQELVLPNHKPFFPKEKSAQPKLKPSSAYAPALSFQEKIAARNGFLQGTLGSAVIERGTDWARHTQIQGWNARMYFKLPPRTEGKDLADVYRKWSLMKRKLHRRSNRDDARSKTRRWRRTEMIKIQEQKMIEVYEASLYRPTAMCFIPAYLDFDYRNAETGHIENNCSLENLFYIRFPNCDLPHYYFWAQDEVWADPTKPNPSWNPDVVRQEQGDEITDDDISMTEAETSRWVRYKKPVVIPDMISLSLTTNLMSKVTKIERELYANGLAPTLYEYRKKWLANGKNRAWYIFACNLRELYPSGKLPDAPPLLVENDGATVASKLAVIDDLEDVEYPLLSPLRGDEAWTRYDDEYWGVIDLGTDEVPQDKVRVSDVDEEMEDVHTSDEQQALYRRSSVPFHKSPRDWDAWLDQISPSSPHPSMTLIDSPIDDLWTLKANQKWEEKFLRSDGPKTGHFCPVCCMNWVAMSPQAQTQHILSHGTIRHLRRRRTITKHPSPLTLLPLTRKPSRRVFSDNFYDVGVEGDMDTPVITVPRRRYRIKAKSKTRPQVSDRTLALGSDQAQLKSPSLGFLDRVTSEQNKKASRKHNHPSSGSGNALSRPTPHIDGYFKRKRGSEDICNGIDSLSFLDSYKGSQKKRRRMIARAN